MHFYTIQGMQSSSQQQVISSELELTTLHRVIAAGEVLLAGSLVIGHNVFHFLPNEVPLLFVLFWISTRLRTGKWKAEEFARPQSWGKTTLFAIGAAAVLVLGSEFVVQPLAAHIWRRPEHISSLIQASAMSWKLALRNLAIVWTFAAFGEETGYRGYLLTRAADMLNRSRLAYIATLFFSAVLFGFGHYYKGPAGIFDSTYSGLVLGGVYLLSGRNLWASVLAHGIVDTFAIFIVWVGWAT